MILLPKNTHRVVPGDQGDGAKRKWAAKDFMNGLT